MRRAPFDSRRPRAQTNDEIFPRGRSYAPRTAAKHRRFVPIGRAVHTTRAPAPLHVASRRAMARRPRRQQQCTRASQAAVGARVGANVVASQLPIPQPPAPPAPAAPASARMPLPPPPHAAGRAGTWGMIAIAEDGNCMYRAAVAMGASGYNTAPSTTHSGFWWRLRRGRLAAPPR